MTTQRPLDDEESPKGVATSKSKRSVEERKTFFLNVVGYSIIAAMAVLTLALSLGSSFFGLFSDNDPGFLYADCSLDKNKYTKRCQWGESASDKDWRAIRRSGKNYVPFKLFDGP